MEIKLTNVTYEEFKKINLTLKNEGIIGITGEKNQTFLKIIAGILENKGTITYDKEKITKQNKLEMSKQVSYVPKKYINNYKKATIEEYMNYMIYYNKLNIKDPKKKIIDSLKIVDLKENYLERNISTLSTTEKKKFQIALSLITNPKIILLEEPFNDFDANSRKRILRLLTQLNEKYKIMIIIATTNSDLLYKYTKNTIILKDYKILKKASSKELYEDVENLLKEEIELPDIVKLAYKIKKEKDIHIDYHRDVRDLMKDIYKHV